MALRPSWQGHLRLSLVSCPVALYKAVEARTGVAFHLINPKTRSRVKQSLRDATTGAELDRKSLVKGFAVAKDRHVLIDPADLDALKLESTKILDLESFVDAASIDRLYWDEPYYLVPHDKSGTEAFSVILEAMRDSKRVGIGRLVLSQRERFVALEARDGMMLTTTLRAHDEVRDIDDLADVPRLPKPTRAMLEIAEKIIGQAEGKFEPWKFTDRYEDAVRDLIERKRKGQKVKAEKPARTDDNVIDLMDALKRSLGGGAAAPRRRANDNRPQRKSRKAA